MHHQFLAESVDEMLGATGYTDFQGLCLGNGHRVADAIAPQAVTRRYHQLVGFACLHFPSGYHFRRATINLRKRNKLVEHADVEQQEHGGGVPRTLRSKKSFAGIVGVEEVHFAHVANAFVLLAVGLKSNATMEKYFQIGPHFVDAVHACLRQHFFEHGEKPRWHTG